MIRLKTLVLAFIVALAVTATQTFAAVVLFTAGADTTPGSGAQSVPATSNPHIPPIDPAVTLTPLAPIPLDGIGTVVNGIGYGPGAFGSQTGGSTGWIHVKYTITAADIGSTFFAEVSNVGDTIFDSAMTIDNIKLTSVGLVTGFEGGIPGGFTTNGAVGTTGADTNIAPTEGAKFAYLQTIGSAASPLFDTVDGTNAANMSALLSFVVGDILEFDVNFMTRDGTATFHDYGLVSLNIPAVVGTVPEPGSFTILMGLCAAGLAGRLRKKVKTA